LSGCCARLRVSVGAASRREVMLSLKTANKTVFAATAYIDYFLLTGYPYEAHTLSLGVTDFWIGHGD
jgi:hypothetical protein